MSINSAMPVRHEKGPMCDRTTHFPHERVLAHIELPIWTNSGTCRPAASESNPSVITVRGSAICAEQVTHRPSVVNPPYNLSEGKRPPVPSSVLIGSKTM